MKTTLLMAVKRFKDDLQVGSSQTWQVTHIRYMLLLSDGKSPLSTRLSSLSQLPPDVLSATKYKLWHAMRDYFSNAANRSMKRILMIWMILVFILLPETKDYLLQVLQPCFFYWSKNIRKAIDIINVKGFILSFYHPEIKFYNGAKFQQDVIKCSSLR